MAKTESLLDYPDEISTRGSFFEKKRASFIEQAAKNLGGFEVEVLGGKLADGTRTNDPSKYTGLRVTFELGKSLHDLWEEANRIEVEASVTS